MNKYSQFIYKTKQYKRQRNRYKQTRIEPIIANYKMKIINIKPYVIPVVINISEHVNKYTEPKGWIYPCHKCNAKTLNYIFLDNIFELHICKHCISKLKSKGLSDIFYHNCLLYCREYARLNNLIDNEIETKD